MPLGCLHVLFGKNVYSGFLPIFLKSCCLFDFELYELCIYFGYLPLVSQIIYKYFLPFSRLSFHFVGVFFYYAET